MVKTQPHYDDTRQNDDSGMYTQYTYTYWNGMIKMYSLTAFDLMVTGERWCGPIVREVMVTDQTIYY